MKYWLLIFTFFCQSSYACSCFELPGFEENISSHSQIVIAELKKSRNIFMQERFKVKITEVLKGDEISRLKSLKQGMTSCDEKLISGQQWLVFLEADSREFKPGWCNPHQRIEYLQVQTPDWREKIINQ